MNAEFPQALLLALFEGTATPLQKKLVRDWLREPANREAFFAALEAYEAEHPQYQADAEAGFRRFEAVLDAPATAAAVRSQPVQRRLGWGFWLAAASVALVLGLGWWQRERVLFRRYETGFGQSQTFTLADGSRVTLNANSTLRVPRFGFGDRSREVTLTGEAEFDVLHTPTHQLFVVKTPRALDVVVLGTEFTVLARERATRVVLNRGKVQVRFQPDQRAARRVTMQPGELLTLETNGQLALRRIEQPKRYAAWKDHRFVFDQTPLREVLGLVTDNFGVRVVVPDADLAQLTITGSFAALTADELLDSVTEALGLRVVRGEGGLFIVE